MEQKDWSCNLGITLNSSPPNLNNRLEVKARVCKKKKVPISQKLADGVMGTVENTKFEALPILYKRNPRIQHVP